MFGLKLNKYFSPPFEAVGRGSEPQLQLSGTNFKSSILCFNPLSPHDALKHHFTSLKTDLIILQLRS